MTEICVALITGGLMLVGNIVAGYFQNKANMANINHGLDIRQAVTDTKLDELAREVREHNNFAKRMPVVEEQIKVINHRLADLEGGTKK